MATITKRLSSTGETSFKVQVRLKGYPPATETFKRKTDATKWAADTESAIREGRYFKTAEAKKHTVGELIDKFIECVLLKNGRDVKTQCTMLEWWKNEIGTYTLADLTAPAINECRDKLLSETVRYTNTHRTPATTNRYLAALSVCLTYGVKDLEWLDDSPIRKVRKPEEPRGRVRYLTHDERTRLLDACKKSSSPLLYAVVVLALSTGARQGEIMNLTWDDVDLTKGRAILHQTKNGERRALPLAGHALDTLREFAKVRRLDSKLLFAGRNPHTPAELRKPWVDALHTAEITGFHFHDLRHSAASEFAMNGASLSEIAEILGHKTLQMVQRYAHLSEGHTHSVVASMNHKIFGGQ